VLTLQDLVVLTGLITAGVAAVSAWRASRGQSRRDEIELLRGENERLHRRNAEQERELQECRDRLRRRGELKE
jgi:hypothetical protein